MVLHQINRRIKCRPERAAFTLVELVMVVTIIGMLAAIAVPRISNASSSASAHAVEATLTNVRKAIDCYYAEHGRFPGYSPVSGAPDNDGFVSQLTQYTDHQGNASKSPGYPFIYGPYLRAPFPANPTNKLRSVFVKDKPADAGPADGGFGWVAVLSEGDFGISATDQALDNLGILDVEMRKLVRIEVN